MKGLGGFFDKYNGKLVRQIKNLDIVVAAVKKHTGIEVEMKNITIRNGVLRIQASAAEKNQLFIKKTAILKELEGNLQALRVEDIQ